MQRRRIFPIHPHATRQPRSGDRMQPTAQAVGKYQSTQQAPKGRKKRHAQQHPTGHAINTKSVILSEMDASEANAHAVEEPALRRLPKASLPAQPFSAPAATVLSGSAVRKVLDLHHD